MEADLTFHQLSPALSLWQRYDSLVKAELFSTRLVTAAGVVLIDPIPLPADALSGEKERWAGVVVTNGNHSRAALSLVKNRSVPIFAHASIHDELADGQVMAATDREKIIPDLEVIEIEGAAPGEIALHWSGEGGVLILGDALINMGSQGFAFLPAKYCRNHKLMRRSLRKLLDYSFERILFAHGTPIVSRARARLERLLDGGG